MNFPTVEVHFGKALTEWEPRGYLFRKGSSSQWCYSFEDDGPNAGTVLGASWMLYHEVIFDLTRKRLGIVPANCPEYKKRPKHRTTDLETPTTGHPTSAPKATAAPLPTQPAPATTKVFPTATMSSVGLLTAAPTVSAASATTKPAVAMEHAGHAGSGGALNGKATVFFNVTFAPIAAPPGSVAGSRGFMDFTRIAVVAVVASLALGVIVYYACRSMNKGEIEEPSPTKNSAAAAAQAVGAAADNGNDEENQGLMETNLEHRGAQGGQNSDDSDGKETF